MTSEKQIAANRANAAKSTGPRTPEGKARTSQNRARHSTLAGCTVLRAEDRESFADFVSGFHAEYQPATATELALVDTMATARWRFLRMTNIHAVALDAEFDRQQSDP